MTNPTSNFGWQMPTPTDLVTDLPADFEVFGQAVDTDFADLLGGANGYILSKASATDLDFAWIPNDQGDITAVNVTSPITGGGSAGAVTIGINAATTSVVGAVQLSDSTSTTSSVLASTPTATKSAYDLAAAAVPKSTVTTAGDVIYATGSAAVTRLGIGTANQVLTVNSGATAPEWKTPTAATPTFAGCVLTQSNSTQSIATNTLTAVTFNTEAIDTDGYHSTSTNTDRITIPSSKVGKYLVTASISMSANSTGARVVKLSKNGSVIYETSFPATSLGTSFGMITFVVDCASADYLTASMFHTGGVSLNVAGTDTAGTGATSFQATYLGA